MSVSQKYRNILDYINMPGFWENNPTGMPNKSAKNKLLADIKVHSHLCALIMHVTGILPDTDTLFVLEIAWNGIL